jgi:pyrroloquinoline-quinone synthase
MQDLGTTVARLDRATADCRLLDHSFYKAWSAGELTLEDLSHYSTQYWRQVEAFPGYLKTLAERVGSDEARDILHANLSDELDQDHAGLWLDFAGAVGANDVPAAGIETETSACVDSFTEAVRDESPQFALGMLYGYESQTPAVAETKVSGLRDHYGIDGPAVEYFRLHGVLDVEHSRDMARAVVLESNDDLAEAERGARAGAEAIRTLLDGVERVSDRV